MWSMLFWMSTAHSGTGPAEDKRWRVVNDTVMGGVSTSVVTPHPEGGVVFSGELSLANNGGFTSTRTADIGADWSGFDAIQMTVIGDGRTYIASVYPKTGWPSRIYYRQPFETEAGQALTVTLPLSDFEAYTYGTRRPDAAPLTEVAHRVGGIGVLLADKIAGPFSLRILRLEGVSDLEQ